MTFAYTPMGTFASQHDDERKTLSFTIPGMVMIYTIYIPYLPLLISIILYGWEFIMGGHIDI